MTLQRPTCYACHRPVTACVCAHLRPVETRTRFVILIHPKEARKIKNNTGRITHLSLPNSELIGGVDFSGNRRVNALIGDPSNACFLLYPGEESVKLDEEPLGHAGKNKVIFVLDATWQCSRKMLKSSPNLQRLPTVSFRPERASDYRIKRQPAPAYLSTIESVHRVLELLELRGEETIGGEKLAAFLAPFTAMVDYQIACIDDPETKRLRYKPPAKKRGLE